MGNFQFKVYSELYGETDAVITDLEHAIKFGFCPCGDGCDYRFTKDELRQLKENGTEEFKPSSMLSFPLNLISAMIIEGNSLLLPKTVRWDKKQYDAVKSIMQTAGGTYKKNSFVFPEDAEIVYNRILNGEDYNLKKKFQFFGTPEGLANRLVELADIRENDRILEPSAGQGAIINAINRVMPEMMVECIELMPLNKEVLAKIDTAVLIADDFLKHEEDVPFNKIIANPPFSKNQDIDHIRKMYELLADEGRIVSIASKHWQKSGNKKETDFRNWLTEINAEIYELEKGEFKESGTSISSVIIVINK